MRPTLWSFALLILIALPLRAQAALPEPVRAMIEAAFEDGDAATIETVTELAKRTNPEDAAEVDAMVAAYRDRTAAEREARLRSQGALDGWSGEGEIGFSRATGNSDTTNIAVGIGLVREGLRWRHELTARADFQRDDGQTTREQFLVALEPQYKIDDRLRIYGLGQYERDPFQGYAARYTLSAGLGYRIVDSDDITLDLRGGPAFRLTDFTGNGSESAVGARALADLQWDIADGIALRQRASTLVESGDTTLKSETTIESQLIGALSARLGYIVEHETNPPAGRESTDTLTRATLVYGF